MRTTSIVASPRLGRLIGLLAMVLPILSSSIAAATQNNDWPSLSFQDKAWQERGCPNDAKGSWFRAAKFGAFIHFGVYSELGGYWQGKLYDPSEQIMGLGERHMVIPLDLYKGVAAQFNPTTFDAHEWVKMIKDAGQRYLIITTKHHDGFCMYPTKTTSFNLKEQTPFHRDFIKELSNECKKQGIPFCVYYSIGDWTATKVMSPEFKSYPEYMRAQLKEIFSSYDNIQMIWLDNYWYVDNQWVSDETHTKELYSYIRSLSPTVIINDRCGRGAGSMDGDYATPENQLMGSSQSRYFEVVMSDTKDDNWGWVKGATNYRSAGDLILNLIDCTSKGGNFVLNVGPTASGDFSPEHKAILKVMGKWLATNGEAIFDTVPAPECHCDTHTGGEYYTTKKGNNVYLHVTKWPGNDAAVVANIERTGLAKAELLDSHLPTPDFACTSSENSTTVAFKKPAATDPYATVIRLSFGDATPSSH
jgi:alpha-L-fucosidase